ncbi:hypothetical protein J4E90_008793 [Alternaria incomplexa]|uniref:uncharacterized protein n=1 Tax=Alternaria incomplexa TaxID=1187928 RepID=UPI00221FACFE|nr:uncharacterized protein J4E90_008793 [Alternaria incomplexa]XP_051301116.1 uncharacterized protein J4E86_006996 [Alternaria arbusti]KAI4908169.1 hypothetical protein J4E90_008793 [Alternaria incomplexa]KAI4951580.1 hypothetical protein J4E86_006996 [Alternaria arbusti]
MTNENQQKNSKDGNSRKEKGREDNTARNRSEDVAPKNKYIPKLILVTTEPGATRGSRVNTLRDTWDKITKDLELWQKDQKKDEDIEKDHAADYNFEAIEADYTAKNQAYRDELENNGRSGRDPDTKAAKREMLIARDNYRQAKKYRDDKRFDKAKRQRDHEGMTRAQQMVEDWLFYQDASRRRRRLIYLDPDKRKEAEAKRLRRRLQYKLENSGTDNGHYDWLHSLMELYDSRDIGGRNYKQGLENHLGNQIPKRTRQKATLPLVGPGELHLWTPRYRRRLVGLRRPEEDDTDSDDSDEIEPHRFQLDEAAVEAERMKTEKKIDRETKNLVYSSHDARRRDEIETYKNSRPNTSNVREATVSGRSIVQDRWGQIQTKQGLFISARESSWDWLTSYDCLGPVKTGWYPETSAVRDDPEDWIEADDLDSESDRDSQVDAPQASGDEPTNNETVLEKPVGESRKAGKATIGYPYPAREFWRDSKPFRLGERKFVTTEWAEETTGRRERHTYRKLQHASPVNSPPQSPVLEEISDATIPMGFPETDTRAVALEPRSRRKICLLNPNRCRAFWPHSLNECWIPYSEQPTRPEEPVKWPIQGIDAPKDVTEGGPDGYVPALGMPVYRSRLYDHYGLMFQSTPKDEVPARPIWPRIGIRVPYEPMTFEDLRLCREDGGKGEMEPEASKSAELVEVPESSSQGEIGKILAPDAHLRGVHEVRSMAVPIIEEAQRPWADPEEEPDENDSGSGSDAESDDDGDLFHESYVTGSFPGGLPAPVPPPTEASGTAAPDETAPAIVAPPEAAVPTEDDQMDDGAEDL